MRKTANIIIRITPELKEKIKAAAAAENRSITNWVQVVIENVIKKHNASVTKN